MSVLIKDMKMPESCSRCSLMVGTFCDVLETDVDPFYDGANKRHASCPLVELPEKHGRLIDESTVLEMIRKSMCIKDLSFLYNAEKSVVNQIYHAPTVIEAEGDET